MSIMETADQLLELMLSWIRQREACAQQLKKMAAELESLREKCIGTECVGSTVSVFGATCLVGAGVATFFTGGAAAPLLGLAGACTGVGVTVSIASKLIEHFSSSDIMKEAQKKDEESNSIAEEIKRQFEQLKKELKELSPKMDPDDLDQQVMATFMGAVGRHSENSRVISFLKDVRFDFDEGPTTGMMLQDPGSISSFAQHVLEIASVLDFFACKFNGKKYKFLFANATEQLVRKMSLKTALKGGAMIVGGAVSLVFALHEAIDNWKEMIKNDHVTEASQSLRDMSNDILEMTRKLKEQLDNSRKELGRLADVKWCIENKQRSPEDERKLIEYVIKNCNDKEIKQWLVEMSERRVFFELLDMFHNLKDQLNQEEKKKKKKTDNNINIIFVAHGAIEENMISAKCLLPLSSINDVLLYSPWNCRLRTKAAYGIATGGIRPQHRKFLPSPQRPNHLPPCWNSMRRSRGQMIPVITVSSITPEDSAWKCLERLQTKHGITRKKRIVLPFLFPYHVEMPFHTIMLALSLVLFFTPFRATVHLAACLEKALSCSCLNVELLMKQYAFTEDNTIMTTSQVMLWKRFSDLYRALKAVYDKTSAPHS